MRGGRAAGKGGQHVSSERSVCRRSRGFGCFFAGELHAGMIGHGLKDVFFAERFADKLVATGSSDDRGFHALASVVRLADLETPRLQ